MLLANLGGKTLAAEEDDKAKLQPPTLDLSQDCLHEIPQLIAPAPLMHPLPSNVDFPHTLRLKLPLCKLFRSEVL